MIIRMISGCTRVCGKAQGFLGLPIRDALVNDRVLGQVPAMQSAWEPTPDELDMLVAGGSVVITILGQTPPPMMVSVEAVAP